MRKEEYFTACKMESIKQIRHMRKDELKDLLTLIVSSFWDNDFPEYFQNAVSEHLAYYIDLEDLTTKGYSDIIFNGCDE